MCVSNELTKHVICVVVEQWAEAIKHRGAQDVIQTIGSEEALNQEASNLVPLPFAEVP